LDAIQSYSIQQALLAFNPLPWPALDYSHQRVLPR
jgi:hypothetical protein